MFCPETFVPVVESWELGNDMRVFQVGPLDDWFPAEEVPHFQYDKTFEQAEWEPLCVLHTSGSTGLPKPITARNVCDRPMCLGMHRWLTGRSKGMIAIGDACHHLDTWQGYTHWVRAWAEKSKRHFVPVSRKRNLLLWQLIVPNTSKRCPFSTQPLYTSLLSTSSGGRLQSPWALATGHLRLT